MEVPDISVGTAPVGTITSDTRYRDWGLPVQIDPPPGFAGN